MKRRHRNEDTTDRQRTDPGEPQTEERSGLIVVRNWRRPEPARPRPRGRRWIAGVALATTLLLALGMVGSLSRSPAPTEEVVTVTQRTSQRISRPSAIASVRASEPGAILEHATISPWERERFVDMEPFEFEVAVVETPQRSAPATTEPPIEVIEVPNVVGLMQAVAEKVLKDAGFSPTISTATTEREMVGMVISQNGGDLIVVGVSE